MLKQLFLGSSPVTSVIGLLIGGLGVDASNAAALLMKDGQVNWKLLIGSLLIIAWGRYMKDHNVTGGTVAAR